MKKKVLIIGGGIISKEYYKICCSIGLNTFLLARSLNNSYEVDSKNLIILDLFDFSIKELSTFTHIIIAVQPRYTYKILEYILSNTTSKILVEKPVCLEISELDKLSASEFDKLLTISSVDLYLPVPTINLFEKCFPPICKLE